MNNSLQKSIVALLATTMVACVTGKSNNKEEVIAETSSGVTVQQGSNGKIIMSSKERDQWISLRKKSSSEDTKLFATLASGAGSAAEKEARAFLLKHPGSFTGMYVLAASLYMQKRYELSGFYAQELIRRYPDRSEPVNLKALSVSLSSGNVDQHQIALKLFDEAANKNSEEVAAVLNKGHLLLELGSSAAAQETFSVARSRCHSCAEALLGLAIAESRLGKYENSKQHLEEILKVTPAHPEALYHLALIYKNGYNDIKSAKKTLNKLVAEERSTYRDVRQRGSSLLNNLNATSSVRIEDREEEMQQTSDYLMPASMEKELEE